LVADRGDPDSGRRRLRSCAARTEPSSYPWTSGASTGSLRACGKQSARRHGNAPQAAVEMKGQGVAGGRTPTPASWRSRNGTRPVPSRPPDTGGRRVGPPGNQPLELLAHPFAESQKLVQPDADGDVGVVGRAQKFFRTFLGFFRTHPRPPRIATDAVQAVGRGCPCHCFVRRTRAESSWFAHAALWGDLGIPAQAAPPSFPRKRESRQEKETPGEHFGGETRRAPTNIHSCRQAPQRRLPE
jgi:hypothetical protein